MGWGGRQQSKVVMTMMINILIKNRDTNHDKKHDNTS